MISDYIISKCHSLLHLSYLNLYNVSIQSSDNTTALFSLKSLKYLVIFSSEPITFNFSHANIVPFEMLEYLEINSCYMVEFLELLKYVGPNIKQMKISINGRRSKDPESIDDTIIKNILRDADDHLQIPGRNQFLIKRSYLDYNLLQKRSSSKI